MAPLVLGLVGVLLVAACGEQTPEVAVEHDGPTIVIRGQDFEESMTIAEVYGQYLSAQGYDVRIEEPAGFRTEAFADLRAGEINLTVDYLGGTLTELLPEEQPSHDPEVVANLIQPVLDERNLTVLDYSPAANGDAMVVRGESEADTISDLADRGYVLGAAAPCFERPECYLGLTDPDVYGIEFATTRTLEFGPPLGEALAAEEVDAVVWNTTAPQIGEEGFRILEDDRDLFPAQNVAPIVRNELIVAYGRDFLTAVNALSGLITTEDLVAWNGQTDLELREPEDVAADWLEMKDIR